MSSQVLIADDDPIVCRLLRDSLKESGFVPHVVHNGHEALRLLETEQGPRLALLDWMMPGLDGLEVCRRLRAGPNGAHAHVFLVSGRQSASDVLQGFEAGVDEFIAKPFEPRAVAARVQMAQRRLLAGGAQGRKGVRSLLLEASRGATGEAILRSHERVGRVVFHEGRVAWIQLAGDSSLGAAVAGLGLSVHEVQAVLDECRKQNAPFLDTVVSWGLASREATEACFRTYLTSRLETLLELPMLVGLFVPNAMAFRSGFSFQLSELGLHELPLVEVSSPLPRVTLTPPPPPTHLVSLAESVHTLEGVVSVVLFEAQSGREVLCRGRAADGDLLRKLARLFVLKGDDPLEESMLTSAAHHHLVRRIDPRLCLHVVLDRVRGPAFGLTRVLVEQHVREAQRAG